ncbi:TPR repeat-containing protein YrrB [Methylacidimicrobium cyclopophantes]|uniref:TPR repeat-containing protein YrrB n=1 Tax=Methylacidimicrobium cyclopophantes TaxID=1041766 RepID=A0A5E6MDG8_9BACT|nr:tetratricopeptide repeat protein [Methylacidimicrobium cyclopophantes]VVM07501.1 TPR repeat-containing protein YrrB [Methylacidimicrobium cyclopophantes]
MKERRNSRGWRSGALLWLGVCAFSFGIVSRADAGAEVWESRLVDLRVVTRSGGERAVRGIVVSADGRLLTVMSGLEDASRIEAKRWNLRPVRCAGWLAADPGTGLVLLQIEGADLSAVRIIAPDNLPPEGGETFTVPRPSPEEPKEEAAFLRLAGPALPAGKENLLWLGGKVEGILVGSPVFNERDQFVGLVREVDPDNHRLGVVRVSAPLEMLDRADLAAEAAALRQGLEKLAARGREPALMTTPAWRDLQAAVGPKEAEAAADRIVAVAPRSPSAWTAAAFAYLQARALEKAEFAARKVVAFFPEDPSALLLLGQIEATQGRYGPAVDTILEAKERGASTADVSLLLGKCLLAERQWEKASDEFRAYLRFRPRHTSAWLALGEALLKSQNWEEAAKAYTRAARLNPQSVRAWAGMAESYRQGKRWEEAASACTELTLLEPKNSGAWFNLGLALLHSEQLPFARASFLRVVQLNPKDRDGWFNLAVLSHRARDARTAIQAYRKALEVDPTFGAAWFNLGVIYREIRRYDDASLAWKKAEAFLPGDVRPMANLALLEDALRRPSERDLELQKLEQVDPGLAQQIRSQIALNARQSR